MCAASTQTNIWTGGKVQLGAGSCSLEWRRLMEVESCDWCMHKSERARRSRHFFSVRTSKYSRGHTQTGTCTCKERATSMPFILSPTSHEWGQDTKSFGQISHVIQNVCPAVTVATLLAQKKKKKNCFHCAWCGNVRVKWCFHVTGTQSHIRKRAWISVWEKLARVCLCACLPHTEGKFTATLKSKLSERAEMRADPVVRSTLDALFITSPSQKCTPGTFLFPEMSEDPNQFI